MNWLKYSGIWINIAVNPFHWTFRFNTIVKDELSPLGWRIDIQLLFLNIRIVLDNGDW